MPYVNDIIEKLRLILIDLGVIRRDWVDIERFEESWIKRIEKMASLIPEQTKTILDVGCGKMYLKKFISSEVNYLGIDYTSRGKDSAVYDINKKEFPKENFDLIFISGFLEYVEDVDWFVSRLNLQTNKIILSYASVDYFGNIKKRKGNAWKNHFHEVEVLKIFTTSNFKLIQKTYYSKQTILYLSKN